jgi:glyoxylase-like metal-dependent hydrolase (beta-lactamase superfamily II)
MSKFPSEATMLEIAEDVWQLTGFPGNAINCYLVGDILVDTGTKWAGQRILRQLGTRRLSLVALTHVHPDHQGSAKVICDHHGVQLACHALDAPVMQGDQPMLPENGFIRFAQWIWSGPKHPVERRLQDGGQIGDFRVVHTPGHTPGHIAFFRERDRVAIVGDLMNGMSLLTMRPGLYEPPRIFSTDLAENYRSILRLATMEPHLICFGHGPPLQNTGQLQAFVERLRKKYGL